MLEAVSIMKLVVIKADAALLEAVVSGKVIGVELDDNKFSEFDNGTVSRVDKNALARVVSGVIRLDVMSTNTSLTVVELPLGT